MNNTHLHGVREITIAAAEANASGNMALYDEGGCQLRVLIVADGSDAATERYTLLVVENLSQFVDPCDPVVGARFSYQRRRDVYCYGMARLSRTPHPGTDF